MAYARPLLLLAACLAALLYFTPSAAVRSSFVQPTVTTAHRTRLPPPTRETFTTRTVAVGDVHGDLPHLAKILRFAGLVNLKGAWIGESSTLVQTGDIVDRGKDTIALYQWFDRLRAEAGRDGGAVVSLLGNHELMNAMGDWRYVTEEDIQSFGGADARRQAMSADGWIGKTWSSNYSITARVGYADGFRNRLGVPSPPPSPQLRFGDRDDVAGDPFSHAASSFVHGGILPTYPPVAGPNPIAKINEIGAAFLHAVLHKLPLTPEQNAFWGRDGPMWSRMYALEEDEEKLCAAAELACARLGVRRLFMGHTPTFENVVIRCGGSIMLIDTGISRAYGGVLSAVEIVYTLEPTSDPSEWAETEVVSTLYADTKTKEEVIRMERLVVLPTSS